LLATVLGKQLCAFDELATLDPVLYRNLTYIKHYRDTDDVADLELNFSYNEEFLGRMRTIELIAGGQDVKVTNENRIMYIHKMAQVKVITETKEQCEHFVAGFRSITSPKWLSLFNIHELQYLISGHTR
jgi:ubiquitin-protein ligase E3 B